MLLEPSTIKHGCGRKPFYPIHETTLYNTVIDKRQSGYSLSISNISTIMRSLVSIDSFKASYSWACGFMMRFNLKLFKPVAVQMKDWNNVNVDSIPSSED